MKMNDYIELVNDKLNEFLQIEYPESIFKSMKYTVMLPGKRLRPVMCLETCRIMGGKNSYLINILIKFKFGILKNSLLYEHAVWEKYSGFSRRFKLASTWYFAAERD